jgi:hypothetical protein
VAPAAIVGGLFAVPGSAAGTAARHLPDTTCTAFPADNVWHASIASLPVNTHSAAWVRHIGTSDIHPDFGPAYGEQPAPYGIPITYVSGSHPTVNVHFQYAAESDRVRYPLGADTKIENGVGSPGDKHAIIVDRTHCRLYETWDTRQTSRGWVAGSGATWSLNSDKLRPDGWTSADAAGLPILPGLLLLSEVKAGHVDHAIRFTAPTTSTHYLWPARHEAGSESSVDYPPMGARFRLEAGYRIPSGFTKDTRTVLQAMKTYGLILADNGSSWYFQGEASSKWPSKMLDELKTIPGSAFEAVDESSLEVSAASAKAR